DGGSPAGGESWNPGVADLESQVGRVVDVLQVLRDANCPDVVVDAMPEPQGHLVLRGAQLAQIGFILRIQTRADVTLQVDVRLRGEFALDADHQRRDELLFLRRGRLPTAIPDRGDVDVERVAPAATLCGGLQSEIRAADGQEGALARDRDL